jgi:hypothetical protein
VIEDQAQPEIHLQGDMTKPSMKNNGTITIDKNVPIPERVWGKNGRVSKYPFRDMKLGDSFFIPRTTSARFTPNICQFKKLNPKFNFTVRTVVEKKVPGVRVWRIKPVKKQAKASAKV